MLLFKEIQLLPEIFLGISIIYLITHGTFIFVKTKYLLIQNSISYLSVLIVILFCFLLIDNVVEYNESQICNSTITIDYLSFSAKIWTATMSVFSIDIVIIKLAVVCFNMIIIPLLILLVIDEADAAAGGRPNNQNNNANNNTNQNNNQNNNNIRQVLILLRNMRLNEPRNRES